MKKTDLLHVCKQSAECPRNCLAKWLEIIYRMPAIVLQRPESLGEASSDNNISMFKARNPDADCEMF